MTDNNAFFRFVWRFNGIVIMLLLLGALICGGVGLALRSGVIPWHDARLLHFDGHHHARHGYFLTSLNYGYMAGADTERLYALNRRSFRPEHHAFMPVVFPDDYRTVNILVVDQKSKASHWLFTPGHRRILSQNMLYYISKPAAKRADNVVPVMQVAGLALVVAEPGAGKDKKAKKCQVLYFYAMDGKAPVKILEADRIEIMSNTSPDRFELFYQKDGKSFAATYALPKFTLESQIAIAGLPKLNNGSAHGAKIGFAGIDQYVE